MVVIASDKLLVSLEFLVGSAFKTIDLLQKRMTRFGSSIEKMGTRKMLTMSDAIDKTFGKAVNGANQMGRAVQRAAEKLGEMADVRPLDQLFPKKLSKGFTNIDTVLSNIDKKIKKTTKSMSGMNGALFSFGLSALFTGMAIKRFGENIIKGLGSTFLLLADEMNAGVKRTMELQAATQFLKFVLFDTFANTELYGRFVGFVVNAVNKVSEFVQLHPGLSSILFIFAGMATALGTVAMILGQGTLGFIGIKAGIEVLGPAITKISKLSFFTTGLWAPVGLAVAGIAASALLILNHLKKHPEQIDLVKSAWEGLFPSVDSILGAVIAIGKAINPGITSAGESLTALFIGLGRRLQGIKIAVVGISTAFSELINLRPGNALEVLKDMSENLKAVGSFRTEDIIQEMRALTALAEANRNASLLSSPVNPENQSIANANFSSVSGQATRMVVDLSPESSRTLADDIALSRFNSGDLMSSVEE